MPVTQGQGINDTPTTTQTDGNAMELDMPHTALQVVQAAPVLAKPKKPIQDPFFDDPDVPASTLTIIIITPFTHLRSAKMEIYM